MVSIPGEIRLNGLPDPATLREERDRALALAYVRMGETRKAIKAISLESNVNDRTVYRAVKRQLDWARAEFAKESAPEADTNGS